MTEVITIRGRLAKRVREEAEKLGVSIDEYLVELLSQEMDPRSRAVEYIEAAMDLLREAREELEKNNVRQAAEKLWGATTLTVKAYAYWKEKKRLSSHGELWSYEKEIRRELGEWVSDAWAQATAMHICFYEGWCSREHVEDALKRIEKLVKTVRESIMKKN